MDPKQRQNAAKRIRLKVAVESAALLFVGVGCGLAFGVGYGLIAVGGLMWINITIGGLRHR